MTWSPASQTMFVRSWRELFWGVNDSTQKSDYRVADVNTVGGDECCSPGSCEEGAAPAQKNVLILMSDTGGGHRASAEAIKQAFEREYGDKYNVTLADLWKDHFSWPFNQVVGSYNFLVKHEFLWKAVFHFYRPQFIHESHLATTAAFVAKDVADMINKFKPDAIISVHPLMQHIPLLVLRSKGLLDKIPFSTVITDLSVCHPTWYHKDAALCFCPTEEAAVYGTTLGLKRSQLRVHGLPIRLDFSKKIQEKVSLRRRLGLNADLPAVLLVGGGEGMGPVEATARALALTLGFDRSAPLGQLVVICGRNSVLQAELESIDWPMPTLIKGFVKNMPEWMSAVNCLITKAGPGTIAEATISGLPMIINGFIAGQEEGNVPYVVEGGAGKFSQNPIEIAEIVALWFGPKMDELFEMAECSKKLGKPQAVRNIVRDMDAILCGRDLDTQEGRGEMCGEAPEGEVEEMDLP